MSAEVVALSDRQPKVHYSVHLTQGYGGSLAVYVEDVSDDRRSRLAVAEALRLAADMIETAARNVPA